MKIELKILFILAIFSFTILAGCKTEDTEIGMEQSTADIEERKNYQILPNYGETRGIIVQEIYNPLDVTNIEVELMNLSQQHFPSTKFFYREGNTIKNISKWHERQSDEPEGLNPAIEIPEDAGWEIKMELEKKHPKYLAIIEDQEYVDKKGTIKGLSIGVILNSTYYIDKIIDDQGLKHTDLVELKEKFLKKKGKEIGEQILHRIRKQKELSNVPVFIALYIQANKNNMLPGRYFASTIVNDNKQSIKWVDINRNQISVPSKTFGKINKELNDKITYIKEDIEKYYNMNFSLSGKGLIDDSNIEKISLELSIDPLSYPSLVGLVQYITPEISNLSQDFPITLLITSIDEPKAIIICNKNQSPKIHIY
ncbi:CamS family sex pheromone protein [Cytobacillus massiliigabonensis]|uniref:CamS family sex pheromone protein n=1 Tax=Cytobacillus massiliigabonensis TaxID=1871011 RepID=UPI000C82FBE5|nr:CamS family sex pheromone protein [Cytobacillus massiliigabonensis]